MPLLSLFTYYQTRPLYRSGQSGHLEEDFEKGGDRFNIIGSSAVRSVHLRGHRMTGQALYTALGVGVLAVGVLGMMGILPIGSVGSIALLAAGGFIIADGLLAIIIDSTRGRLSRRFHTFMATYSQEITVDYTYGDKTYPYSLQRNKHPTFFKSSGWKVKVTKQAPVGAPTD